MPIVYWSEEELKILADNTCLNTNNLLELLPGRSYNSIVQKRKLLGLQWDGCQKWEEWEKDILKDHTYLSALEIHRDLLPTRSPEAIKSMRISLKSPHLVRCSKCGTQIPKKNQYNICPDCKRSVKSYNKSLLGKYRQYKHGASRRNIAWELTLDEFSSFWEKPCGYCGNLVKTVGIDRVDNTKGYALENCVPCCHMCNHMKLDYGKQEWFSHMKRVLVHAGVIHETT